MFTKANVKVYIARAYSDIDIKKKAEKFLIAQELHRQFETYLHPFFKFEPITPHLITSYLDEAGRVQIKKEWKIRNIYQSGAFENSEK